MANAQNKRVQANTVSVGAAEGCDGGVSGRMPSQPSAAPTENAFQSKGMHFLIGARFTLRSLPLNLRLGVKPVFFQQ
ncbi:hypothetical protein QCD79_28700, partial [Pseudomonas quasicaspiana]|nr:hypothetical protein [Pseudomonas quasicaspiana]